MGLQNKSKPFNIRSVEKNDYKKGGQVVDRKKTNAIIAFKGHTVKEVCEFFGISRGAYYARFRRNTWSLDDAKKLSNFLELTDQERQHLFFE